MKHTLRVLLPLLLTIVFGLLPSGRLCAQQAAAAPTTTALDELTGPIALYPDAIVIHVLTAAQNYDTLKLFAGWLEKNASLKGTELQDAALKAGYSEALVALALFPQVIQTLVQKPDWTKALGQAVTADKKAVSASIQRLRAQAQALGNLKTTPQQIVTVTNTIVQIQPANPQVIYVPTYPQTVYVQAAPPPSSTSVAGAALVGFTVGVLVGANNNHYHHHYDDYWDNREDYYEDRRDDARDNQDQRQSDRQGSQDQRQTDRQGNQDARQSNAQGNQETRQSTAQANQGQRQSSGASAQTQAAAGQSPRSSAAAPASGGGASASRSSGMSSGGVSGYQSGSATRSQSSRGSSSMSSSRGGGGGGGGGRR